MRCFLVTATVTDEICLAERHGAGNEFLTLDHIPGTAWWGSMALLTGVVRGVPPDDQFGNDLFRQVFHSGDIIFTNLYPSSGGQRGLPVPLTARTLKSAPGFREPATPFRVGHGADEKTLSYPGVKDWLWEGPASFDDGDWQPVPGYYVNAPPYCEALTVKTVLRGHNDSQGPSGTSRPGRVFTRQNLLRGQQFLGLLRAANVKGEADLDKFVTWHLPDLRVRCGIGRHPGFVRLEFEELDEAPPWQPEVPAGSLEIVTVTLLADAILVDEWLRPLRDLPSRSVAEELGLAADAVSKVSGFARQSSVSGWNGAHNRPREAEWVLAAGSAFFYELRWPQGVPPAERARLLNDWQRRGLGLRRSEGFGEMRLNDPFHEEYA